MAKESGRRNHCFSAGRCVYCGLYKHYRNGYSWDRKVWTKLRPDCLPKPAAYRPNGPFPSRP